MTYNDSVVFVETSHFTHWVSKYLSDEEYRELQQYLMRYPESGQIIRASGGIRKLRWARQGQGKSNGLRTIYYWAKTNHQIYMLTIYSKSDQENINSETLARITKHLEAIK